MSDLLELQPAVSGRDFEATPKTLIQVEQTGTAIGDVTFDGRTNAEMDHEMALAHAAFTGHRSYAGFAIHHYGPYRERYP